jgi:hypothetical protein
VAESQSEPEPSKTHKKQTAIVDDVFIRRRIEELISEADADSKLKGGFIKTLFKHPLSAAFIAATISLVVSLLTIYNDSTTRALRQEAEERAYYHGSVSELARTLLVRSERGALLYSAILGRLGGCDEQSTNDKEACREQLRQLVYDRKKAYDEAYLAWNSNFADYLFNIRGIFRPVDEEELIYKELKTRLESLSYYVLRRLDSCLDELYKAYQRSGPLGGSSPGAPPEACSDFRARTNTVRDCAVVLAEEMHWLVSQRQSSSRQWASQTVSFDAGTPARIKAKCTLTSSASVEPATMGASAQQSPGARGLAAE